ncbi:hypothetical protein [Jannaschia aquimarina]|uniref:Uncharacterized protein n=1 Tax=Jannaschia aquimarina TaxID=935700 RepID=A0A0D1EBA2_9RHOB|nr:hypothetical protein [Jannaschia aquimarina]KIT14206.1 hypothetical protein jaqu_39990 [Jannaschia aquimarina]SNS48136.1 hypothetical protein SAMN05421775_101119 [Jannaschia aquimarina]
MTQTGYNIRLIVLAAAILVGAALHKAEGGEMAGKTGDCVETVVLG